MAITTSRADIELTAVNGTAIPLQLVNVRDARGNLVPKHQGQQLAAAQGDSPLGEWIEAVTQKTWARGAGLDYNVAPGVCTRFGVVDSAVGELGRVVPAGAVTQVPVVASGNSQSPIVAIEEYEGAIFVAQQGDGTAGTARVMQSNGGVSPLGTALALGAGEYIRDMVVSGDGAGNQVLWVSSSDQPVPTAGGNGRLHRFNASTGAWTSTSAGTFGSNGRNALAKVYWRVDGVGAWRLVTISGRFQIAYTRPEADPLLAASWVEGVRISSSVGLYSLVAARRHVWVGAGDGLYDLTEDGDSPNLIGYQLPKSSFNGTSTRYLHDYVYMNIGTTLHRVFVGEQGALASLPGPCGPCWGTAAENTWTGPVTALGEDQGALLAATYNPQSQRGAVWYGLDRRLVGIESPNPLIWHGPEVASSQDIAIQRMQVSSLGTAQGGMRLWIAAAPRAVAGDPWIGYVSLPPAGSSLSDLMAAGPHRFAKGDGAGVFNATCELWSLPEAWNDPVAIKINDANGINSAGLSPVTHTQLLVYNRVDPEPGSTAWGPPIVYDVSPVESGGIPSVQSGYRHEYRIDFGSPLGEATPPKPAVLNAIRRTAWRRAASFMVLQLDVEYGAGATDLQNGTDQAWTPDQITTQLKLITDGGKTTLRTRDDARWTVILKQFLQLDEELVDAAHPYGKRVQARLVIGLLAGPL